MLEHREVPTRQLERLDTEQRAPAGADTALSALLPACAPFSDRGFWTAVAR